MPRVRMPAMLEIFRYSEWANTRILSAAAECSDAQLDQPFEMGLGSMRATLLHMYHGEQVWLNRWQGRTETQWPSETEQIHPAALRDRFAGLYQDRAAYLTTLRDADLDDVVRYRDSRGSLFDASRGDMLLQGAVHSQHHRAQALNMLRQAGAALPKPGNDYIFMKIEQQAHGEDPGAPLDPDTLRTLFEYGDWANERLYAAAEALSHEQLDRPFDMGVGSLRATLLHIRFAEQWWLENWVHGPGRPFPELPTTTGIPELRRLTAETVAGRNALLAELPCDGLSRIVSAMPRPGIMRTFQLGVTMLQLCLHGVHHRAQAVNMLRRVGGGLLELDYMTRVRRAVSPGLTTPREI